MRTVLESLSAILVLWQTLVSGWMIGRGPCRVEGSGLKWGRAWASRRRSVVPGWGPFRMRQQFPKHFGEMSRMGHWPQPDLVERCRSPRDVAARSLTGGLTEAVPGWLPRTAARDLTTARGSSPARKRPRLPTLQQPVTLADMPDRAEIWHLKLSV